MKYIIILNIENQTFFCKSFLSCKRKIMEIIKYNSFYTENKINRILIKYRNWFKEHNMVLWEKILNIDPYNIKCKIVDLI